MYNEIPSSAITIDTVKPRNLGPIKDYQHIPDGILNNYAINTETEQRVLQEYDQYKKNIERLEKARIIRKNRIAPGLSNTILMPTKVVDYDGKLSQSATKQTAAIDYSEFDSLKGEETLGTKDDILILGQVMSASSLTSTQRKAIPLNESSGTASISSTAKSATLLENVRFISEMGFSEEQATMALLKVGNDRDRAIEQLLSTI